MDKPRVVLLDILRRLQQNGSQNDSWETCVQIARELGADALNIAKFQGANFAPIWMRVSTHERGGLEEYVLNDYMSVDPILVPRAAGILGESDHISLHRSLETGALSDKEIECYHHLLKHQQSDYLTFRVPDRSDDIETLVVFACSPEGAATLKTLGLDQLSVIANLFALHVVPPTPKEPEGKVPLLYDFLSERERDVLTCVAQGMQNSEIAHHLGISEVTVRMHSTGARKKMKANTRAQALALALVRGLITL